MPIPLIIAIPSIIAGVWVAAEKSFDAAKAADGVYSWFQSGAAADYIAERVNTKLAAAGLDLEIPGEAISFNPLSGEMPEKLKKVLDKYVADKINAKTGSELTTLEGLDQDQFIASVSGVMARKINRDTGSNITAMWPVEKLQSQLQTEAVRQFDNRGRYAGGAMFKPGTLAAIRDKIAAKHPALMKQVKQVQEGGYWGPPLNEAHRKRREKAKARMVKYRQTHKQIWLAKNFGSDFDQSIYQHTRDN